MKPSIIVALCAGLCASQALASPQDDDWEFQEDPAQKIMVAAVRYDSGAAIVVQCRDGALTVVLAGLGQAASDLQLQATRADGRTDVQSWATGGAPGAYRSEVPARDARFMRGGGQFSLRAVEGATTPVRADFDLPTQNANLDKVLTGCGWAVSDERDLLKRAGSGVSLTDPNAGPERGSRRPPSRSVSQRSRTPPPPPRDPQARPVVIAERQISCVIRDMRLTACKPDRSAALEANTLEDEVEWLEGRQAYASSEAPLEGSVIYANGPRLITVVDYITTPAR